MRTAVTRSGFQDWLAAGLVAKALGVVALWLMTVQGCAEAFAAPRNPIPIIDVTTYGARPNDGVDDTGPIAAAVAAAALRAPAVCSFPEGEFEVQDPTTGNHNGANDGGIIIPAFASKLILQGRGTTIKVGPRGITNSAIRCFGDNCVIDGFTFNPNADQAPPKTWTADAFDTKDNSGFELNGCENSVIRDCHVLNGDKSASTYSTGTIVYDHDGADNLSGSAGEKLDDHMITLTGGTWPAWVDVDAAITIAGERYQIAAVPSSTTCQLVANSATKDDNNPGSDVGSTADWSVAAYATTSGGENHFLIVNGRRCRIERCLSISAAYAPFFVSGVTTETVGPNNVPVYENANYVTDCTAVNFKGNGLRINSGRSVFVRGFVAYSTRNDGRACVLADAGSSQGDLRTERIFLDECELYCNPDGDFDGAASTLKLAATYQVHVRNSKIECGAATNNVAIRLEDNLRSVFLEDCYIKPVIVFTPASATGSIFQGDLTGHADNGAGKVRYTVSGTPASILVDREMHVRGSGVLRYNGPQKVIGRGLNYIDTERNYVSGGTLGSAAHGQTGVESFKMRNCTVDGIIPAVIPTVSFYGYMIDSCNAYNVDIEGCTFNQFAPLDIQYGCVLTDYATENGWSMYRFVRNKVYFDSDKTCRVHRGQNTAGTELRTSGKTIVYGNEKHNKDVGTVYWTDETNPEREILFHSAGEQPRVYRWTTYPTTTAVAWSVGDAIENSAPTATSALGWVCVEATGAGTWRTVGRDQNTFMATTDFGATPDDATDDTSAIQAALTAANVYTAANLQAQATVHLPRGVYLVNGAAGGGALTMSGIRVTLTGEGTLKLGDGDDADAVLFVGGNYNRVQDIIIDGNASGTPSGRGEGVRVTGDYCELYRVTAKTTTTSGNGNTILINDGADYCRVMDCTSVSSGENAIRVGGDYASILNFRALGFVKKGITVNADENLASLVIQDYYAESSTTNAAANGLQVDIGPTGFSVDQVVIRNANILLTGASGFGAGSKFVRVHQLSIDGFQVQSPNNNVPGMQLVEGLGRVSIKNAVLPGGIDQDASPYDPTGSVASVADNGSGFARFTSTSHDVRVGEYIVLDNTANYTGAMLVTAEDANTFTTNRKYVAGALSSVNFYTCIAQLSLEDVTLGSRAATKGELLSGMQTPELFLNRCQLLHYTTRGIAIANGAMPLSTVATIDVRNTYFESNNSAANYCLRTTNGTEWGSTSRKLVWSNNTYKAVGSNNGGLLNQTDMLVMATASGSPRTDYTLVADTLPASANTNVTWQVGDRFWRPGPVSGESPGWICTAGGTFATGTFTAMPSLP